MLVECNGGEGVASDKRDEVRAPKHIEMNTEVSHEYKASEK